jgi:hypothetical protein
VILLATGEFFRNIKRNLVQVVLLTVMALILVSVLSVLLYEQQQYAPFEQFQGKEGYYYCSDQNDYSDCIEETYCYYNASLALDAAGTSQFINTSSMPRWLWSNWEPRLASGQWFKDVNLTDQEYVPIIVGGKNAQALYLVGDRFTVYDIFGVSFSVEVVGILVHDTTVVASQISYRLGHENYQQYYSIPYDDIFFIAQDEYLEALGVERYQEPSKIITIKDGMEEEQERLEKRIMNDTNGACVTLSEFNTANREIFLQELRTYMPLIGVGLLLILICSYAASYVNLAHNRRHYSIFYLLGADEGQRIGICMGNGLGNTLFSVLLLALLYFLAKLYNVGESILLMMDWHTGVVLAAYYVLYLVLAALISYGSMKGLAPKEALKAR